MKMVKIAGLLCGLLVTSSLVANVGNTFRNGSSRTVWITNHEVPHQETDQHTAQYHARTHHVNEVELYRAGAMEVLPQEIVEIEWPIFFMYVQKGRYGGHMMYENYYSFGPKRKREVQIYPHTILERPAQKAPQHKPTEPKKAPVKQGKEKQIKAQEKAAQEAQENDAFPIAQTEQQKTITVAAAKKTKQLSQTRRQVAENKKIKQHVAHKTKNKIARNQMKKNVTIAPYKNKSADKNIIVTMNTKEIPALEENYDALEHDEFQAQQNVSLQAELDAHDDEVEDDAAQKNDANQDDIAQEESTPAAPANEHEEDEDAEKPQEDAAMNIDHNAAEVKRIKRQRSPVRK